MLSCQVIASALYKCIVIVAHSIAVKSQNKCNRGKDTKDTLIYHEFRTSSVDTNKTAPIRSSLSRVCSV